MLVLATVSTGFTMGKMENKKAIVLADFGTTYLSALKAITTIQDEVKKDFPNVTVRVAFTSNIIRAIWQKRREDATFMKEHKDDMKEFLNIKGPLATIADLQDEGYRAIIVQPCHIYSGEEYADLCSYIHGLNAIHAIKAKYMPFVKLVVGRPALGTHGPVHDYHKDMEIAAKILKADVALAKEHHAALVYMGHGNEFFSTGIYAEFQQVMRRTYPGVKIFIGTVEGFPSLNDVVVALKHAGVKSVVVKPLMIVAGDHANNDMAGNDRDSWKNTIKRAGIHVTPIIHGLGENRAWARIYVQHIKDAAKDNDIKF